MKTKTSRCPLLRDEKVIYCKNFPLRKMIPVEKIYQNENLCLKDVHRECPFFDKNRVNLESDLGICPFVGFEIISFCVAYPLKKITANNLMTSPCNTGAQDTCPIYRNLVGKEENKVPAYKGFLIDEKKQYLQNHMWIERHNGKVRIGLDDFGQYVIGEIQKVVLRNIGDKVDVGEWLIKIEVEEGHFELAAPVKGSIVNVNRELTDFPGIINLDPYGSGWIGEVIPESEIYTVGPEEAKRILDADILKFQNLINEFTLSSMPDGGEFLKDIRKKIRDKEKIIQIIRHFLKGKEV
ncbi:MAG: hypothetical protein N2513_02050 [Deltaproteobacteria bacterium]|nr:hypothetical protein [Deltaproteobacteria bacterium]